MHPTDDQMIFDGFFKDLYTNIMKQLNQDQINKFDSLTNDIDRFKTVSEWAPVEDMNFNWNPTNKNGETAVQLKDDGNAAFQLNKWMDALDFYNEALIMTPAEEHENQAILIANRSAVFYHVKLYDLAIADIELSSEKYPIDKIYKIKERLAKCYLARSEFGKAVDAFKQTLLAIDTANIPEEQRLKLEKDVQIMIKLLINKQNQNATNKKSVNPKAAIKNEKTGLNMSVGFDYNEMEGHYAKAIEDIKVGDKVLEEAPHCCVLLQKFSKTHCQHCFKRTIAPLPCETCTNVVFCSVDCKHIAQSTYHKFECSILPILWQSGSSINCHLALRIMSQKNLKYFTDIKDKLSSDLDLEKTLKLPTSDYRTVYNLVKHEQGRQSSFLHYTVMATFLVQCLKLGNYFKDTSDANLLEDFIGGLVLRNLQFLQYNTHEIYELRTLQNNRKTVFIGGGVYPTLARFNHSCNPGVIRYYKGTSVVVHSVANLKSGTMIGENYGPLYSQNPLDERQSTLKSLYKFDCNCTPCVENWPLYADLTADVIRLKCSGVVNCNNPIIIHPNCNDFMLKCEKCLKFVNILKGLKAVQDTEMLDNTAKQLFNSGDYQKARLKYQEILTIMDENLVPPFRDYCLCQQSLKECLLELGNKNIYFKI